MVRYKLCKRCTQVKSEDNFQKSNREKDGLQVWCSSCRTIQQRERKSKYDSERAARLKEQNLDKFLKRHYGISLVEYTNFYDSQNGKCKLCGNSCPSGKKLAVDHCHKTGRVRGLLCVNCNTALGGFRDSIDTLERAVAYLKGIL